MPLLLTIILIWAAIVLLVLTLCLAAARGSDAHAPRTLEHEPRGGELVGEPLTTPLAEATAQPRAGA